MKKLTTVFILVFLMAFSSVAMAANFSDVKSTDWFNQSITDLSNRGYINGYGNGTFRPNANITRAEFVTILAKASGESLAGYTPTFSDVPNNHWGYNHIGWALAKGITSGKGSNRFCPDDTITRQEMVTMIYRYKLYKGEGPTPSGNPYYTDFSSVSDYAKDSVRALYSYGGINGTGNKRFSPTRVSTRAQAAQIVYNCLILNERQRTTVFARNFAGFNFVKAGSSPETGFDSAGFVRYVYGHFGVTLTGDDSELMTQGRQVSRAGLNMGDLVCFGGSVPHVGIYIGNNQFIHAVNSDYGVVVTSLNAGYYSDNFRFGRRLFNH